MRRSADGLGAGVQAAGRKQVRVHCVGGSLDEVQSVAELLAQAGLSVSVSGACLQWGLERLRNLGVRVRVRYDPQRIDQAADCLIYSPAVPAGQAERAAARVRGVPQQSVPSFIARLMAGAKSVAVAGGHGKSTTVAMLGEALAAAGLDPTVLADAYSAQWRGFCRLGQAELLISELSGAGWEQQRLSVSAAAVLGVDTGHMAADGSEAVSSGLMRRLTSAVRPNGLLLVRDGQPVPAGARSRATVQTFGLEPGCDWWAADLRAEQGRYRFRIFFRGGYCQEVRLRVPGRHNVMNALAAFALASWLGADGGEVAEALAGFGGCARRLEHRGHWWGAAVFDDCARCPCQLRAGIRALREMFPRSRLWCVFQPAEPLPADGGLAALGSALAEADRVLVTDAYSANGLFEDGAAEKSARIADFVRAAGVPAKYIGRLNTAAAYLQSFLKPGDVLLAAGAGDVGKVADVFTRRVSRYRQAG